MFSNHKTGLQKTLSNLETELPKLVFGDRGSKQIPLPFKYAFYAFGGRVRMLSEQGLLMNLAIQSITEVVTGWRIEIANERNKIGAVLWTKTLELIPAKPVK